MKVQLLWTAATPLRLLWIPGARETRTTRCLQTYFFNNYPQRPPLDSVRHPSLERSFNPVGFYGRQVDNQVEISQHFCTHFLPCIYMCEKIPILLNNWSAVSAKRRSLLTISHIFDLYQHFLLLGLCYLQIWEINCASFCRPCTFSNVIKWYWRKRLWRNW